MAYDKDRIKQELTLQDIKNVLRDLGSDDPKIIGNNLVFQTICHGGHKHKLYYYPDSYSFHCYTDCSDSFDIYELVRRVNELHGHDFSFYDSVGYIADFTGKDYQLDHHFQNKRDYLTDDWEWLSKFKRKEKTKIELPSFDESVLDVFLHLPHESWLDEGITREAMAKYEIGYYVKENAITIPVRDENGRLIGVRRRSLNPEELNLGKKYMPVTVNGKMYGYSSLFNLYGLYQNKDTIRELKKCCIFEAEKSVLKAESFYPNHNFTVATCNSNLSSWQRDRILECDVDEVFIAYDKEYDEATSDEAEEYKQKLLKLAQMFTPYVRTYIIWDQNDYLHKKDAPVDQGQRIFEQLLMEKYQVKTEGENN